MENRCVFKIDTSIRVTNSRDQATEKYGQWQLREWRVCKNPNEQIRENSEQRDTARADATAIRRSELPASSLFNVIQK
jgi:hypothetical protein